MALVEVVSKNKPQVPFTATENGAVPNPGAATGKVLSDNGTWVNGGVAGDQACASARRTGSFTGSATFADVTFDATDVENDTNVIEHDNTLTDRITCKETGLYLVGYSCEILPTGSPSVLSGRVRINDTTVIPNSQSMVEEDTEITNFNSVFLVELTANDYLTFQIQTSGGDETIQAGATFFVTRATGEKGDVGPAGGGDVTAAATLALNKMIFGDTPAKGVKSVVEWTYDPATGSIKGVMSGSDWALEVINTQATAGGKGLHVCGGETLGDLAMRICDANDSFTLLEMEADQGYNVLGSTYAAAEAATPGLVAGWDNRHTSGLAADFNTQNGIYRVQNKPVATGDVVSADSSITTTSTTHILASGMTITPPAGTYMVAWSATMSTNDTSDRETWLQVYAGGAAQGVEHGTERGDSSTDNRIGATTFAKVTVNGSQAIEGRWRTVGSTGEMYGRTLAIWSVAP